MKLHRFAGEAGFAKRAAFVLVIAAAVAFAIWYSFIASSAGSSANVATLLPAETSLLVHIPNVNRTRSEWEQCDLYQLYREPAVQAFLGKPAAQLLANHGFAASTIGDLEALDATDVFVASVSGERTRFVGGLRFGCNRPQAESIIARWKAKLTERSFAAKQTGADYEGHQMEILEVGELSVTTTFSAKQFFFASNVEDLKALLDRLDGRLKTASLAQAQEYRAALAHMPAAGHALLVFARPNSWREQLPFGVGATALCYATRFDGGKMRDVAFIAMAEQKIDPISRFAANIGTPNTFLYSTALLNPASASASQPARFGQLSRVTDAIAAAGITADEWNAAFGPESSLLADWNENARWPGAFLLAEVKDSARANDIATRVGNSFAPGGWSVTTRNGVQYHTLSTLTGFMVFNPTIGVSDKLLVVGFDAAGVEAAIKRAGAGGGLVQSRSYQAASNLIAAPKNMFVYLDLSLLFRRLDSSLRPLIQMAGALMPGVSDWIDASKLPAPDIVAKHLGPLVVSENYDRDGYVVESCGPITWVGATIPAIYYGNSGFPLSSSSFLAPFGLRQGGIPGATPSPTP